jgi:hypothetical protein
MASMTVFVSRGSDASSVACILRCSSVAVLVDHSSRSCVAVSRHQGHVKDSPRRSIIACALSRHYQACCMRAESGGSAMRTELRCLQKSCRMPHATCHGVLATVSSHTVHSGTVAGQWQCLSQCYTAPSSSGAPACLAPCPQPAPAAAWHQGPRGGR